MPGRMTAAGMIVCLFSDPLEAADTGGELYLRHCASCHGANLEGQPNWRRAKSDGTYPAPPHDADGHTWHHDDAMLRDYVTRGGQAVLDDMGVSFKSAMPGFGEVLSPVEIDAILKFIMSRWPDRIWQERADRLQLGP